MLDVGKWCIFHMVDDAILQVAKTVCVFGPSGNEAFIITKEDDVYAFGANVNSCLALASGTSTLQPKKVEKLSKLNITSFSFGSAPHVLALTGSGQVYGWGGNSYSQVGLASSSSVQAPTLIGGALSGKTVTKIACGGNHSLALISTGEVYAWGYNNSGQIGSGSTVNQATPRKVTAGIGSKEIVNIACGQSSSMAIDNNGELYSWGYNGNGQLGLGCNTNQPNPCRVTGLIGTFVTKIVCGYAHSLALSDTGNIYAWGANQNGQLGTGSKANLVTPSRIATDRGRFIDITACHYSHMSSATTALGKIYVWGLCKGQSVTALMATNFKCADNAYACLSSAPSMSRPLTIGNRKTLKTVSETMAMAFNDKGTSDVTFIIDDKFVYVHKAILKIRCEYFKAMFQDHWPEDGQNEIKITSYSYSVFYAFLRYLYTDQVDLAPEDAIGLLDLANAYCEPQLKRLSEMIIKNGITVQNAIMLLAAALKYDAEDLEEFCFKFCVNHMTAVTQTDAFQNLDENTLKDFILKASQWGAFKY
ncbi:RCC1 and BTB domain-containing protein 1-like [Dendronephthya gigantea]|uniref:RCC1 and BTB domain-containing protein 1-like n=1 Tax=Dendronephthya gigantea TaxID=151771 RepID=UPI00106BEF57|nr:RCC1 and BTB domain-containing protein 1-like [Dendronephthya gigantea]XP_028401890.1 RCC1 and BTB domain-containing protein 1-like [Dendronephthya gigantea]